MIYNNSTHQTLENWKTHYRTQMLDKNLPPQMREEARKKLLELCEDSEQETRRIIEDGKKN